MTPLDYHGLKIHANGPAVLDALAVAEVIMDENRILLQEVTLR